MDPGVNTNDSTSAPRPNLTLAWPLAVQISLVLAVTAALFFLIGRWSHSGANALEAAERVGPALDVNRATKAELRLVPGLGDSLSQSVINYREKSGGFRSLDDLRHVRGIGPKTLERIRPHLFIADMPIPDPRIDSGMLPSHVSISPRSTSTSKKESSLTSAINVNNADQSELQKLPGIGPKLSQRILDERAKAPFKSIDDLRRVSGIGPKTLEKVRPYVTIE